jgi:hypothetical protein
MATVPALVKLTNDMAPAISSLGVANIMHFKNCQVPLLPGLRGQRYVPCFRRNFIMIKVSFSCHMCKYSILNVICEKIQQALPSS